MTAYGVLKAHTFSEITLKEANKAYAEVRASIGLRKTAGSWFTKPTENLKFVHTAERYTYGMSLMPSNSALKWVNDQQVFRGGIVHAWATAFNMCPHATPECRVACLATAGKGRMNSVLMGRTARTLLWAANPDAAYTLTVHHIRKAIAKHGVANVAVRLNVLSDVPWEKVFPSAFWQEFSSVQFYDYTKDAERAVFGTGIPNYHLTFSASEHTRMKDLRTMVGHGINVAVVIGQHPDKPKPATWAGFPTADGNATDARYLDPQGVVVLLGALGKAKSLPVGIDQFVKPVRVA